MPLADSPVAKGCPGTGAIEGVNVCVRVHEKIIKNASMRNGVRVYSWCVLKIVVIKKLLIKISILQ